MAVLGKAEGEFAASLCLPIFWVIRKADRSYRARNGTAFALNTGKRVFGVTAFHVVDGWREDQKANKNITLQMGNAAFDLEGKNTVIDCHEGMDLLTFQISTEEVRSLGKTVLEGYQNRWPPSAPQKDRGIYYAGFPGVEKIWMSPREISFGVFYGGGVASSVSDRDISSLIEREIIQPVKDGPPLPPENFNFQGISGGPMLSVIEHHGLRTWALAGVIYQGPNTSGDQNETIAGFELFRARRAHFILPDGYLDVAKWDSLQS